MIFRANISETREIVLSHRDNVIAFEFASLHFAEPRKNRFIQRNSKLSYDDRTYVT